MPGEDFDVRPPRDKAVEGEVFGVSVEGAAMVGGKLMVGPLVGLRSGWIRLGRRFWRRYCGWKRGGNGGHFVFLGPTESLWKHYTDLSAKLH